MRQVTAYFTGKQARFRPCWKCGAVDQAAVDRGQEFCFEAGRGEAADHHAAALLGAVEVEYENLHAPAFPCPVASGAS